MLTRRTAWGAVVSAGAPAIPRPRTRPHDRVRDSSRRRSRSRRSSCCSWRSRPRGSWSAWLRCAASGATARSACCRPAHASTNGRWGPTRPEVRAAGAGVRGGARAGAGVELEPEPEPEPELEELPPHPSDITPATLYEIVWYREEERIAFALQPVDGRAAGWARIARRRSRGRRTATRRRAEGRAELARQAAGRACGARAGAGVRPRRQLVQPPLRAAGLGAARARPGHRGLSTPRADAVHRKGVHPAAQSEGRAVRVAGARRTGRDVHAPHAGRAHAVGAAARRGRGRPHVRDRLVPGGRAPRVRAAAGRGRTALVRPVRSAPFAWDEERDPPAGLREAQREHGRLRETLLRDGWRRVRDSASRGGSAIASARPTSEPDLERTPVRRTDVQWSLFQCKVTMRGRPHAARTHTQEFLLSAGGAVSAAAAGGAAIGGLGAMGLARPAPSRETGPPGPRLPARRRAHRAGVLRARGPRRRPAR